mgnify:CR=1 FL=1
MRENAAKYGVDVPPQALEPDEPTDATPHTAAAATLTARNFATVDGFLGEAGAGALRTARTARTTALLLSRSARRTCSGWL